MNVENIEKGKFGPSEVNSYTLNDLLSNHVLEQSLSGAAGCKSVFCLDEGAFCWCVCATS